jgi:hypothetical protein
MTKKIEAISIKFKPDFYGQFENFENKIWNVIAEYVDNAWQSFDSNRDRLIKKEKNFQFSVSIEINKDADKIEIIDNAAGIDEINIVRALEIANTHSDVSGLNEFGMGLKTASNWLSKSWKLSTSALGESVERTVNFDLNDVKKNKLEELPITSRSVSETEHYTKITLRQLTKNAPSTNNQIEKIKKHLSSIYRKFLRENEMTIIVNDEKLIYSDPEVLSAPFYNDPNGKEVFWKKEINFSIGSYSAKGFIGILSTMSTSEHNGLSLFRRGRVIEGSYDEKYRPKALCGQIGSPRYKRIFGELELEGFSVSFNKGSFQEQEDLEALIEAIQTEISSKSFDLYTQAEKYIKPKSNETNKVVAKGIVETLKKNTKQDNLKLKVTETLKDIDNKTIEVNNQKLVEKSTAIESHEDYFEIDNEKYKLKLELINDSKLTELYRMAIEEDELFTKKILYKINLAHPFFQRYEQFKKQDDYLPIIAIIRSLVLAELRAPAQGTKNAGNIRLNFNHFLRNL